MQTPVNPTSFKFKQINFKGQPYVEVKERVRYLHEQWFGRYEIKTKFTFVQEMKMFIVHATLVLDHPELGRRVYQGMAQEVIEGKGVNSTSALENAETSAVGRACAMAGIGSNEAIASMDEIMKAENRRATRVSDELADEEKERQRLVEAETAFSHRMAAITSAAELTALAKETKAMPAGLLREFQSNAIKLYAGLHNYVADRANGRYLEPGATGAQMSAQRGGAAVDATLSKLKQAA